MAEQKQKKSRPDLTQHYAILKRPVFTEKSTRMQERGNCFTFEVAASANKVEIRKAVEAIFGVTVLKVNTMNVPGKLRRFGSGYGRTSAWKKAMITVKEGEAISLI
jgi:large subunit ribosomal protein L23